MKDFKEWCWVVREWVEETLQSRCEKIQGEIPARLAAAMDYTLTAPGKRLRPMLVFLGADACCGETISEKVRGDCLCAATAVEMIHAYSLIHDDLPAMDDDDLRRGRPTCHRQFDEATAILAGDALQSWAFEILTEISNSDKGLRCLRVLTRAAGCRGMVGGQIWDMFLEKGLKRPDLSALFAQTPAERLEMAKMWGESAQTLAAMQDRKTGALITAAVWMGGILGGATEKQQHHLGRYGQHLGLMFQITDDLLDVSSSAEVMGKEVGKDAAKGKTTWATVLGVDRSIALLEHLHHEAEMEIQKGKFSHPQWLKELLDWTTQRKN